MLGLVPATGIRLTEREAGGASAGSNQNRKSKSNEEVGSSELDKTVR